jgi:hypothetical protein
MGAAPFKGGHMGTVLHDLSSKDGSNNRSARFSQPGGFFMLLSDLGEMPPHLQAAECRAKAEKALLQAATVSCPIEKETHRIAAEGWVTLAVEIDLMLGV